MGCKRVNSEQWTWIGRVDACPTKVTLAWKKRKSDEITVIPRKTTYYPCCGRSNSERNKNRKLKN